MFRRSPAWVLPIVFVAVLCGLIAWITTETLPEATPATANHPAPQIAPQPSDASSGVRPTPSRSVAAAPLSPQALAKLPPIERHAHLLRLEPGSTLVLINEYKEPRMHHYRYEQDYRGVRVAQRNFVVNEYADGRPPWISGVTTQGLAKALPSVTPRMSAAQALDMGSRMAMDSGPGRLVIDYRSVKMRIYSVDGRPHLAYIMTLDGSRPESGEPFASVMVIDAVSGALLNRWDDTHWQ